MFILYKKIVSDIGERNDIKKKKNSVTLKPPKIEKKNYVFIGTEII